MLKQLAVIPSPQSCRKCYTPFILRVPSFLFTFALTLCLVGLLEYVSRSLPQARKGHHNPLDQVTHAKRQASSVSMAFSTTTGAFSTASSTTSGAYVPTVMTTTIHPPTSPTNVPSVQSL